MSRAEMKRKAMETLAAHGVTDETLAENPDLEHGVLTVDQLADKICDAADKIAALREEMS